MANASEIFHKRLDEVMNGSRKKLLEFWLDTHVEEKDLAAANEFIFSQLYKKTKDKRFEELAQEYSKQYNILNERDQLLREYNKEN